MEAGPAQVSPRRPLAPPTPQTSHAPQKARASSAYDSRTNNSSSPHNPTTSNPRPNTANTTQHKPTIDTRQPNTSNANSPRKNTSNTNSPRQNNTAAHTTQSKASNSPRHKAGDSSEQNQSVTQEATEEEATTAPDPENRIHITGFPPYTQAQDVTLIFSRFGDVRIEKMNSRLGYAVLQYATKEEALEAIQQTNNKVAIYGEFLYVRAYTATRAKPTNPKRDFTRTKQRGEIIEPEKIDLSGEFSDQVERILGCVRLTQEEATTISTLYSDLERVLQSQWPGCVAMPFGSITTGLGIKSSDADCYMHVPGNTRRGVSASAMLIGKAKRVLLMYPTLFTEILAIPRANTPIVKFFHIPTSTNCDLSFKTPLGAQNSRLIAFLLHSDPRLLPVAVLIKYWAKVHNISGTGKLTNYALTMMIIFYFQQPPISILPPVEYLQSDPKNDVIVDYWNTGFNPNKDYFPPCTNTSSVPELLGGFFKFYSTFDFEQLVICPYLGKAIEKKQFHDIGKLPDSFDRYINNLVNGYVPALRVSSPFVVQDPFEQCHNVASPISSKLASDIVAFLKFAANAYDKEKPNGCRDFLKTILLHKPKISKTKPHPEYRITLFPKLVQSIVDPEWKSLVRKLLLIMFQTMLKIKLEKLDERVNPVTLKEKERYKGFVTKPIWKRKQFTRLYSMVKLDYVKKQTRITEEIINVEKETINLQFNMMLTFANEPRNACLSIKFMKGESNYFADLGHFFVTHLQTWFAVLATPYTKSFPMGSADKLAETIRMIDTNLANNALDSDDDDSTTENVDTNTADSDCDSEPGDDMDEDQRDDEDLPNKVKAVKIEKESSVPGTVLTDTH